VEAGVTKLPLSISEKAGKELARSHETRFSQTSQEVHEIRLFHFVTSEANFPNPMARYAEASSYLSAKKQPLSGNTWLARTDVLNTSPKSVPSIT